MTLRTERIRTLDQIRAFVEGNEPADFQLTNRYSAYAFIPADAGPLPRDERFERPAHISGGPIYDLLKASSSTGIDGWPAKSETRQAKYRSFEPHSRPPACPTSRKSPARLLRAPPLLLRDSLTWVAGGSHDGNLGMFQPIRRIHGYQTRAALSAPL